MGLLLRSAVCGGDTAQQAFGAAAEAMSVAESNGPLGAAQTRPVMVLEDTLILNDGLADAGEE